MPLQLCVPVPLYHCFGIVMGVFAAINCGASIVFPAPAFDAEVWEALLPRLRLASRSLFFFSFLG
jgi:acyl-CoA synthetase (AMP-forming)/AMP-acid ligase II